MKKGILLGIAGGSGSGKTLFTQRLLKQLQSNKVLLLQEDSYYKDLSYLNFEHRKNKNFDHPDAFDEELLISHIKDLLHGKSVNQPIYDFSSHTRKNEVKKTGNSCILILEGILVLHRPKLRDLMDIKLYIDEEADIRFIRRLKRDTESRGRTVDSVIEQYMNSVRPMHLSYVEPSKRYADLIIPGVGSNDVAIDLILTKIHALLKTFDL